MDAALQSGPAGGGLALPAAATIVAAAPAHGIETDLDEVLGFAPNGIASATAPTSSCPPSPTPAPPPLRIPIRTSGGTSMVALAAVRFKRKAAKSRATQAIQRDETGAVLPPEEQDVGDQGLAVRLAAEQAEQEAAARTAAEAEAPPPPLVAPEGGETSVVPAVIAAPLPVIEVHPVAPLTAVTAAEGAQIQVPSELLAPDKAAELGQHVQEEARALLMVDEETQTEPVVSWFGRQRRAIMGLLAPSGPESTPMGALFNLVNSIVGAGILGMPSYFGSAGLVLGIILLLVQCWLMRYTVQMLTRVARAENSDSYGALGEAVLGRTGGLITQICIVLNSFGSLVAYVVLTRDFVEAAGAMASDNFPARLVANLLLILIVFPLLLKRDLNALRFTSFISIVFVLFVEFLIIERTSEVMDNDGIGSGVRAEPKSVLDFFSALPIATFAFNCHTSVMPVYTSMHDPTPSKFDPVSKQAYILTLIMYTLMGIFGYLAFGDEVDGNVLNSISENNDSGLIALMLIMFCFTILFTFPLVAFALRISLHYLLAKLRQIKLKHEIPTLPAWGESTLLFGLSLLVGNLLNDVSIVFGITGAISSTVLSLVLPPLMFLKSSQIVRIQTHTRFAITVIVVGLVIGAAGLICNIVNIATGNA